MLNKNKKKLIAVLAGMAVALGSFGLVSAQTALLIEFETQPLFKEVNFLPGNSVSRYAKITNNTEMARTMAVSAKNVVDVNHFGDAFELVIKEGSTVLYQDTLTTFFSAGEVELSDVASGGGQARYDFIATLKPGSGNEYQEKALGFDIVIGFLGETAVGSEGGAGGSGTIITTGGGGGGVSSSHNLSIFAEEAQPVSTVTAFVSWKTTYRATSRVVYGTQSGVFDYNSPPNYGYQFSTAETNTPAFTNGVFEHGVILSGLIPDTAYYYRVISTASPPTISAEHNFSMVYGQDQEAGPRDFKEALATSDGQILAGQILGQTAEALLSEKEVGVGSELFVKESPTSLKNQAFLGQSLGLLGLDWPWWLFCLLIVILLLLLWRTGRKEKK